ncbi:hypothetical protein C8F01DRAFT_1022889, partial [Mycena amicta]
MDIEMDDLALRPQESTSAPDAVTSAPDVVSAYWAWSTAALLALISISLSISPRVLLLLTSESRTELTVIEVFLALHGSIWLFAVAVSLVLNVPSASPADLLVRQTTPPRHPLLIPLTVASCTSAFLAYNTVSVGSLGVIVSCGSAIIGIWGAWASVFGNSSAVSKKTGADKHTSAFLFGNKAAASSQKKEWRKAGKG